MRGIAALLCRDWPHREQRRACIQLKRRQRVDVHMEPAAQSPPASQPGILARAQRAHSRLSWQERLARNAHAPEALPPTLTLYGVPAHFADFLGLSTA